MALTGLTFVSFMTGGIATLHLGANAEVPPDANPPVSVAVRAIRLASGYTITERFVGRLEPVRQTRLAFERAGLVTEVLFEEGDQVRRGAIVARLDTAKLEAERVRLQAQRKELQARQALARVTLDRQRVLASKGWQSEQRYDEARFKFAEISASIGRLDAAMASINVDIGKSVLKAPYAGRVADRLIDEGAVVDAGTALIELLESGARQVRVGVSVKAAQSLHKRQIYRLSANGRVFQGRLISKRPDLQTGTRTVTVLLAALGGENVPFGEIVELMFDRKITAEGMWLPIRALSEGRKGLWSVLTVVQRDGEPVIAREAVEVLHVDDGRVFVRGTISDGAKIVLNGTNRIIPGQKVALAAKE
jgi:RND family efflux transporter MFP subunit